jgi:spore coat protein U-like protein
MGGKAALLLVLGFSLIFMVAGKNFNQMATGTVENFSGYFYDAKARHLTATGVNLVTNKIFFNSSIADQTFNYNFDGGTIAVTLTTIDNIRELISIGNYNGVTARTRILLKPGSFSRYAYFSNSEGANIWWTTRDTVWGPMHTNGSLRVADRPVFMDRVTIDGSLIKYSGSANPQFLGGLETGVHIDIPPDGVSDVADAAAGGAKFTGKSLVYLEFRGDSVRYKFSSAGQYTYALASTFAPNGVIFAENAELRIKGNVKGKYTVAASGTGGDRGKIFIDDNVTYNTNPRTNPGSQDLLGIVAERDVVITENSANNNDVQIDASIYSQSGSFVAEDYQNRPVSGAIYLYGGVIQNARGPVGTFWGSNIVSGFSKRYRYDSRLAFASPPAYPGTGSFEIASWFE